MDPEVKRIYESISNSKFKWRTAKGIANEVGLDPNTTEHYLKKSEYFIKSEIPNKKGQNLFTTSDKYYEKSSLGNKLISALTNKRK